MSLSLPEDLEPYLQEYSDKNGPGAYAIELERPTDLPSAWDREFETRPPYWSDLVAGSKCLYVGGTTDLLSRLEDHRDGEVRLTALTRVCEIRGLHTAWVCDSEDEAWKVERALARMLQRTRPEWFTHQN